MIEYRVMNPADIAAGLSLCRKSGWNQVERDWQIFLQLSPNACRVAFSPGNVVGTVTTISYQHLFSWIGMVLVDPENQRQGIGMKLLQEALHILSEEETVKLDATPAGRAVYLKLDFVDEYKLGRMSINAVPGLFNDSPARPVKESDLAELVAFDAAIFGASRQTLLEWMWEGAKEYAFIIREQDNIKGFCMGRPGFNFTHIGPVVAEDIGIAKGLVSAALHNCAGKPVILDALHFEAGWISWLEAIGFTEQRPFIRMFRGSNRFPGVPEKQFAILGPEFG